MYGRMKSDLHKQIFEAGVIGAGGAGFPTHVKLYGSCEVVIANGAECEPLLQCDQQVMTHYADAVIDGIKLALTATGAKKGIIALKKKHIHALPAIEKALKFCDSDISIFTLGNYYPAGDEQILVYEVLGRIVPEGGRPGDVGCLVQNVQTLVNIANAKANKPVTQRILSVHGCIQSPKTLCSPIGTSLNDIVTACGGLTVENPAILSGGAMMGIPVETDSYIGKTTSGLYFLPADHPLMRIKNHSAEHILKIAKFACEQCSFCTAFCPRFLLGHNLYPNKIMQAVGWDSGVNPEIITGAYLCCECGLCGTLFACPLRLSPDRYNRQLKSRMRTEKVPFMHQKKPLAVRAERANRQVSVDQLIHRLALQKYVQTAPLDHHPLQPHQVRIHIAEHIGSPSKPLVHVGEIVTTGQKIAQTPLESLGTTYHASITGTVTDIRNNYIQITAQL
jgi:Na+-translocating ferredoxin:NAD+ oxidoreductase RnfC subunit